MFIVFEGITSSGKSTQARMLVARLKQRGVKALFNHEPTPRYPFGKIVMALIEKRPVSGALLRQAKAEGIIPEVVAKLMAGRAPTEIERQMLYMADRRDDLLRTIRPALKKGHVIVQDRYELSTLAFGGGQGLDPKKLMRVQAKILGEAYLKPDMTFYFDVSPEIAARRLRESEKTVDIYEHLPKMRKIRAAYLRLLREKKLGPFIMVNARLPLEAVSASLASYHDYFSLFRTAGLPPVEVS